MMHSTLILLAFLLVFDHTLSQDTELNGNVIKKLLRVSREQSRQNVAGASVRDNNTTTNILGSSPKKEESKKRHGSGIHLKEVVPTLQKTNLLFIMFDDLRPELSIYGRDHMITPNFERLAKRSVTFDYAFNQVAVCNPSRYLIYCWLSFCFTY